MGCDTAYFLTRPSIGFKSRWPNRSWRVLPRSTDSPAEVGRSALCSSASYSPGEPTLGASSLLVTTLSWAPWPSGEHLRVDQENMDWRIGDKSHVRSLAFVAGHATLLEQRTLARRPLSRERDCLECT